MRIYVFPIGLNLNLCCSIRRISCVYLHRYAVVMALSPRMAFRSLILLVNLPSGSAAYGVKSGHLSMMNI